MEHAEASPRNSGEAADTGTATHLAIQQWHDRKGHAAAIATMRERFSEYPRADLDKAERMFDCYSRDPRNPPEVVTAQELEVSYELAPHESDPTQQPIYLLGHFDQIRVGDVLWDVKTGEPSGWDMLHEYAAQLAAYFKAAEMGRAGLTLGGVIRPKGYIRKVTKALPPVIPESSPDGIFFRSTLTPDDCDVILYRVRLEVAQVRSGKALYGSGTHCSFCPQNGLSNCLHNGRRIGLSIIGVST